MNYVNERKYTSSIFVHYFMHLLQMVHKNIFGIYRSFENYFPSVQQLPNCLHFL